MAVKDRLNVFQAVAGERGDLRHRRARERHAHHGRAAQIVEGQVFVDAYGDQGVVL